MSGTNKIIWYVKSVCFFIVAASGILLNNGYATPDKGTIPVSPRVTDELSAKGETEFFVVLKEQGDTAMAGLISTKEGKTGYIYDTLRNVAASSQTDIINWLNGRRVNYKRYWIVNQILIKGDAALLREILRRSDVARIDANPAVAGITDPAPDPAAPRVLTPDAVEWGIQRINADDVWNAYGIKGEGIVVAGQDTGVDWDHPALKGHYRGWNGVSADHNYNWHDSIHNASGNPCGNNSPAPCDDDDHGTHTMGTMVGDDGGGNKIGAAPGAKWIACRNMDEGFGTPASYTECFEWFMAPYPIGGDPLTDGDPSKAPHIINNSWGCPPSEGCNQDTLESIVAAVRAAGIMVVVSNGNEGPSCSSTYDPPALYRESFSVGATDSGNGLASFSSRGPVTYKGETYIKPDISGPGVNIRSSVNGGGYESGWSGTSMAGPHIAGAAALLWSALPVLIGNIDLTEYILEQTALPKYFTSCGDPLGAPNNGYGHGIVDAYNAVRSASPQPAIKANGSDGPVTITTTDPLSITVSLNAGALSGSSADWWAAAETPFGWYHYDVSGNSWKPGLTVTYQGPLFNLAPYQILNMSGLPVGPYAFYFGVDMNMNGSLDMGQIYYDSVKVTVNSL